MEPTSKTAATLAACPICGSGERHDVPCPHGIRRPEGICGGGGTRYDSSIQRLMIRCLCCWVPVPVVDVKGDLRSPVCDSCRKET